MKIKKYSLSFMATIIALTLTGCDIKSQQKQSVAFNLTEQQWQNEIQQRFDTINGNGEPIKCMVSTHITQFPYLVFNRSYGHNTLNLLQILTKAELLTEQIEINKNDKISYSYIYDISEEGKKYYKHWPNLSSSGFCFGKVVVKSVTKITPNNKDIEIEFQYIIDKLPPNLEPENKLQTGSTVFSYDEETKQLYSKYGIGLIVKEYWY
ncbi:hypothetical protein [Gilliamella sp. Bif1-4]|jgi:hypothetical protein|uniref:hypothetical protein n=1 Tax=Gilliamella sp. Bif1-4 TaxID=3120233 RepID=UPI00080E55FC|nr:hypothetical protein [Gilliamella apicola]OCG42755.1 hypothetical protein A9G25_01805 [Gilliamella apicola]